MTPKDAVFSLKNTTNDFIDLIGKTRKPLTQKTYRHSLSLFSSFLEDHFEIPPSNLVEQIPLEAFEAFINHLLDNYSASSISVHFSALRKYLRYILNEENTPLKAERVQKIFHWLEERRKKQGRRLPQFPEDAILDVIKFAEDLPQWRTLSKKPKKATVEHLISLRDRALILTLADTGMRIHEICQLTRGNLDLHRYHAIILGKNDKEALVRFSERSMKAIQAYLNERSFLDGGTGRPLSSLPVFARHDKGGNQKVKPISPRTGQNIASRVVSEAIGDQLDVIITPHSFRHFFVTTVLRATGNIKVAQDLARHADISTTELYAHLANEELDRAYYEAIEKY